MTFRTAKNFFELNRWITASSVIIRYTDGSESSTWTNRADDPVRYMLTEDFMFVFMNNVGRSAFKNASRGLKVARRSEIRELLVADISDFEPEPEPEPEPKPEKPEPHCKSLRPWWRRMFGI